MNLKLQYNTDFFYIYLFSCVMRQKVHQFLFVKECTVAFIKNRIKPSEILLNSFDFMMHHIVEVKFWRKCNIYCPNLLF